MTILLDKIVSSIKASGSKVTLVVGAQRGGTQIGSKIMAHELEATLYHERHYGISSIDRFIATVAGAMKASGRSVIHSVAMMHVVELLPPDVSVVCMRRDLLDILASQEKINFIERFEDSERNKFNSGLYGDAFSMELRMPEVKYLAWDNIMKPRIQYAYDLPYEGLVNHPLFKVKDQRKHFGTYQTE
jgi:hypothetical protein